MNQNDLSAAESAPTAALGASHRWKVLGVGVAANVSFSAAATGIPTTAVWLRADYHLSTPELGLALGALGIGVALTEIPWGLATDRWGDRPVLLVGLFSTALALLGMALLVAPSAASAPPLHWLVLALCVVGLLGGSVNGASGRAVMRWFGVRERGLAMSIRQSAVPAGGGLGALTMPWLASHVGFSAVYGLLTLACAASGVLAIRWLHEPPHFDHAGEAAPGSAGDAGGVGGAKASASPFRDNQFWGVVIGIGLLCTPQFSLLTFATVFLHDYGHIGIAGLTATMVSLQAGAIVMRIWSGRYTDRHGNRRVYLRVNTLIATAAFVLLALLVALAHPTPPALMIAMVVLAGICVSAWHGVAYTELATLAGREYAGTALGMTNTCVYISWFLTPLAIPHLLALGSWTYVWAAAAACALATYPLFPKNHKPVAARAGTLCSATPPH